MATETIAPLPPAAVTISDVCVENPVGTFTQWQRKGLTVVSGGVSTETITWSSDGNTYSATAPTGTLRPGICAAAAVVDLDIAETQWCVAGSSAVRRTVRNQATGVITTTWERANGTVFVPTPADLTAAVPGPCATTVVVDQDVVELPFCVANTPIIRRSVRDQATGIATITWWQLDGTSFVPSPAQIAAAIPGACPAAVVVDQDVSETQWCVASSPAVRRSVRNEVTGVITFVWERTDGTVFVPTAGDLTSAVPGPCPAALIVDQDIAETQWCIAGSPAVRRTIRNELTGAITIVWERANGTAFVPTPAELTAAIPGPCATSDQDVTEIPYCLGGAPLVRRVVRDQVTGTTTVTWWTIDGLAFSPSPVQLASAVAGPCSPAAPISIIQEATFPAVWTPATIPAGKRLLSLAVTVVVGTASITDSNGTTVTGLPYGWSTQWSVAADSETLTPPTNITPTLAGSRVVITMTVA